MTIVPSLQCLRLKSCKIFYIVSFVKKKKMDLLDQELVDLSGKMRVVKHTQKGMVE